MAEITFNSMDDNRYYNQKSILEKSLANYDKTLEHELDGYLQAKVIECLFILYLDEQEAENQN